MPAELRPRTCSAHGPDQRCFDCATDRELAAAVPPAGIAPPLTPGWFAEQADTAAGRWFAEHADPWTPHGPLHWRECPACAYLVGRADGPAAL